MNIIAYIDPATGALVGQILAGIFITAGVVLAIWWRKITTFFKGVWTKLFGKKKAEQQRDEKEDELRDEVSEISEESDETPEKTTEKTVEAKISPILEEGNEK